MAAWHFLKHLTCTHSSTITLSRRFIRSSSSALSSLPFLINHHKLSYQWPPHAPINIQAAAVNAKFSTASSSTALPEKSLNPPAPYISVLIHCTKDNADVLAEALLCFGASSVSMDQDDVCQSADEICISSIFPGDEDINVSISHAADSIGLKEIPRYEVKINEEEDWIKGAQESFRPVEVTEGLWVVPQWSTPPDVHATNIILYPGLAFGTGEHATTKLCLLLLHGCIKGGECILDYGTGTGILAIAALKFGAAFAVGVDVDSQAIASASQNAALNNIGPDKMQLHLIGSETSLSSQADWKFGVVEGENTCEIQTVTGQDQYDVVIANILLNPLLDLAGQIISFAKPGAVIGLSGILSEQVQYIIQRYSPFLEGLEVSKMDEWACVSGRKRRNLDMC
ncbi:S-adenosyl-L-methionine-dependent methyltransferase [Sesbania bispinosa]|nr:S-adenosyl-L-methionine-dependent methyltransferase [Sesbania bispinosa]